MEIIRTENNMFQERIIFFSMCSDWHDYYTSTCSSSKCRASKERYEIAAANTYGCNFDAEEEVSNMIARTMSIAINYKPSMMLDCERKKPMEVEVILGNPVRRAEANNVSVPYLDSIYAVCSAINDRNLGRY
jgi:ketopantoate reductase